MYIKKCYEFSSSIVFLVNLLIILLLGLGVYSYKDCKYLTKVGSTYKVNCTYNNNNSSINGNSSYNLRLQRHDNGLVLNSRIVNNDTIEFEWPDIPRINVDIECVFVEDENKIKRGVWIRKIVAESPPFEVRFDCISYDFQYLKCHYEKPIQNFTTIDILPINCIKSPNESSNSCTMPQPDYDPINQNIYNFTVRSKNCFGELLQTFSINHFDNVIPRKPNVSVSTVMPNGIILRFTLHDQLYLKTGLYYEIELVQKFHPYEMKILNFVHSTQIQTSFEIANLYAFKSYKLTIRSKTLVSNNITVHWSPPTILDIKTPSKPPEVPPNIAGGCYHVGPDREVHIYWETVPETGHNGPNFGYEIELIQLSGNITRWRERLTKDSFTTTYFLNKEDYEIRLKSVNDVGSSSEVSINVPLKDYPKPNRIRTIFDGVSYQLSWDSPDKSENILKSYTVSWCVRDSLKDTVVNCSKDFHFSRVSNTIHSMSFQKGNHFAVSANYLNGSSEMVWTECIASDKSDIGSVASLHMDVTNSTTIYAYWSLTCIQKTLIKGHRIQYCESNTKRCSEKITSPEKDKVFLSDLTPHTEYMVKVSIYSEEINGSFSEFVTAKTQEDVSSPPRNLKVCNVTRDTIELTWMSPEHLNGELRHYKIWYNDRYLQLTEKQYLQPSIISYKLQNLKSNEEYRIYVVAVTVSDSERSNGVIVRTSISDPGVALISLYERIDPTHFKIRWTSETSSSSDLKLTEIAITNMANNQTKFQIVPDVNDYNHALNCSLSCSDCAYQISVRLVNMGFEKPFQQCSVDGGNLLKSNSINLTIDFIQKHNFSELGQLKENLSRFMEHNDANVRFLYGSWSAPVNHTCFIPNTLSAVYFTIGPAIVLSVVLPGLVFYYLRKRYEIAKQIGIILPNGLDTNKTAAGERNETGCSEASDNDDDSDNEEYAAFFDYQDNSLESRYYKSELFDEMFDDAKSKLTTNSEGYIVNMLNKADKPEPLMETALTHPELHANFISNGYVTPESLKLEETTTGHTQKNMFPQKSSPHINIFDSNGYVRKSMVAPPIS